MVMPETLATGSRKRREAGFTLIELMVVLAIMVLLTAMLPIALNRMLPSRRVATTADRLLQDIRWLQSEAINRSAPGRMVLEPTGYRLEIEEASLSRRVVLSGSTTVVLRTAVDKRQIQELVVFPDGTGSSGIFDVEDSGRRSTVELSMLTARVRRRS
jgi:general secretion pathway protein H